MKSARFAPVRFGLRGSGVARQMSQAVPAGGAIAAHCRLWPGVVWDGPPQMASFSPAAAGP
jgi:hypothetical protein